MDLSGGGMEEEINYDDNAIDPNTFYERTIAEPYLQSQLSSAESYFADVKVIKPFTSKDVMRIMSYGTVSDRSSSGNSPTTRSMIALEGQDKCSLIQQCMNNASLIFKKIDEVIEENKKLTEKKIKNSQQKADPYSQTRKFKNKNFSPLEALSKIEEINNIIDFKKSRRTDIILPAKYLPGQKITVQQEEFIRTLQRKLEKLQRSYQHWTKWRENPGDRFSAQNKTRRKVKS